MRGANAGIGRGEANGCTGFAVVVIAGLVACGGLAAGTGVGAADGADPGHGDFPRAGGPPATDSAVGQPTSAAGGVTCGETVDRPDDGTGGNQSEAVVERVTPANGSVSVSPGTELLFEAAAAEYGGDYVLAEWTVDGEPSASVGPFQSEYAWEGEAFLRHTFDEAGTYTVAVSVADASGDPVGTANWTVTVERGGNESPTVAGSTPDGNLTLVRDRDTGTALGGNETVDLSVEVSDPDGDLHRVIWFLGVADARLGTSSVEGSRDTAGIAADEACDSCPVLVWVVDESGAVTERAVWTFTATPPDDEATNGTAY